MRFLPTIHPLLGLFLCVGIGWESAHAQTEPADANFAPAVSASMTERQQVVLQVGEPTTIEVGPYDEVISLEPDRLTVTPLSDGQVELLGGPRSGAAAMLILSGSGAQTIVVRVEERGAWYLAEEVASENSKPTYRYRGSLVASSKAEGQTALSTGHALSLRQTTGDQSWAVDTMVTSANGWRIPRLSARYSAPGVRLSAGDTSITLGTQQLALAVRGGSAFMGTEKLRVGLVGGVQRRASRSASVTSADETPIAGLAAVAHGEVGKAWWDGQVGVITSPDQAPRLSTRAGVGMTRESMRGYAEFSTLGGATSALLDGRFAAKRTDIGARVTWQSAGMSLTQQTRGSRLRSDLSAAFQVNRRWTLTGISVAVHQGSGDSGLLSTTTAMGGIGARWQPNRVTAAHAVWRSGTVVVGDVAAATHGLNAGIQVDPTTTFFGGANAEYQWTSGRSAMRHHVRLGYGDRYRASVIGSYRGLRLWGDTRKSTSERIGLGGRWVRGPVDSQVDLGLDHFVTPAESGWRPLVSAATTWRVSEPIQLDLSGWRSLARDENATARWRMEASVILHDTIGSDIGWFGLSGVIRGQVFEDLDGDAVLDPGESVISGITVTVDGVRTTQTDRRGQFRFGGVLPGRHSVKVDRGFWASVDGAEREVTISALRGVSESFAMRPGGHIEGRLFVDGDSDRRYDPGEFGYSIPQVTLSDVNGTVVDTVASQGGLFSFRGVRAGTWKVSVALDDLPAGIVPLGPLDQVIDLAPGTTVTAEFPVRVMRSISGTVWVDTNRSGTVDPADYPASNMWVHLSDGSVAKTNADGGYLFRDLEAARYHLWVDGGNRDRYTRLTADPEEINSVDLFIPEPAFLDQAPDGLLAIRAATPVIHVAAGAAIDDPFVGVQRDLSRTPLTVEREWFIDDPTVARVESGVVRGTRVGTTILRVRAGEIESRPIALEVTGNPGIDVTSESAVRLDVIPDVAATGVVATVGSTTIPMGGQVPLTATVVFSDGSLSRLDQYINWDVDTDGIVTVTPDGWLEATGVGTTTLTAIMGDARSQQVEVSVVADPIMALLVPDETIRTQIGRAVSVPLTARHATDRRSDVSAAARWTSTNPGVIQVTANGTLLAMREGDTTLWATVAGVESPSIQVSVRQRGLAGVTVATTPTIAVGETIHAVATAVYEGGGVQPASGIRWASSDSSVIDIDINGQPVAVGPGRVQLIAQLRGGESEPVDIRVRRRLRRRGPLDSLLAVASQ